MSAKSEWKWVDPKSLATAVNKRNWRQHPERQKKAVKALIKRNGWARALLYNTRTKKLIDGHCRLEIALDAIKKGEKGWDLIPVQFGEWSESQEKELLATLDPSADMATRDTKKLDSLTRDVAKDLEELIGKDSAADEIMKLTIDINSLIDNKDPLLKRKINKTKIGGKKVVKPASTTHSREAKEETLGQRMSGDFEFYKSSNQWGIPDIPKKAIYAHDVMPNSTFDGTEKSQSDLALYAWNHKPFKHKPTGGFLSYFTEDYRFNCIYKFPHRYVDKYIAWKFFAMFEPDFSTYPSWPLACQIWNVFKSRWVSNYFYQMCDIETIPLIRVAFEPEKRPWLFEILPDAPTYVMNCGMRTANISKRNEWEVLMATNIEYVLSIRNPKNIILYAAAELQAKIEGYLPKGPNYVFLESWTTARRRVI